MRDIGWGFINIYMDLNQWTRGGQSGRVFGRTRGGDILHLQDKERRRTAEESKGVASGVDAT